MEKCDKRETIMKAALELVAEHGFHGSPMAMIAERAGVGAGTIYRYFENKEVLIQELYRNLEERIFPYLLDGYQPERPIRERFLHLGTAWLRYVINNPLDFRYLEQFHNSPYGVEFRRDKLLGKKEGCGPFHDLFSDAISQQVIKDLPLVLLFSLFFGPLVSVARDHILGFVAMDDQLIASVIEACWDGVRR